MEQLFGARIREQLFGARIRDPKGTAFRGPNRGPNRTTFRGPGLLAVDVSPGALWRPPFQSAHLCPPAIFSGPEWYTTFRGLSGTRMEQLFGARIEQLFGALWMFLQGLFGCHCFNLHICVHQGFFLSPNGIRLFGARIQDPNGTAFRGESGPESNDFSWPGALGCGCFSRGSLEATVSICTFVSTSYLFGARMVYDFSGPNPGPEWNSFSQSNNFSGPGALGCGCPPGALWRPPFQSAHWCPPAIFSGPEWNDFLGPEPSARMVVFFLWCLNTLCKLDFFVFWGSKA